jgi:tetratricopeptide (TPR) repeat protein
LIFETLFPMPKQADQRTQVSARQADRSAAHHSFLLPLPHLAASKSPSRGGSSRRRLGAALAGAVLLVLIGGIALHRRQVASSQRAAAHAPPPDPVEARLQRAEAARPNDAAPWLELGTHYEQSARPFEAMWEYAEARRLRPGDGEIPQRLAAVLQTGHVVDEAEAQLQEALRARPDNLALRERLAELFLTIAQPESARSVMAARRPAAWGDADAVLMLGRAMQACGDLTGAVSAFNRSLSLQPRQGEAWYRLGRAYLAQGRLQEARDGFFHATMADRAHAEYPYYAGLTYLQQGGPGSIDAALNFFGVALSIRPGYTEADYQYAVALERKGQRQQAMTRYSRAILDDMNAADANRALGRCFAATGDMENAHRYLGRYDDLTDRPAAAAREFQAMAVAAPNNVKPALLEGQIYLRTQENARAVAVTEAALKRHPNDPELLERLAVLKINRGDLVYARRLLQHWLTLAPRASRPLWLLGRCALGEMKYPEAIDWLEKAVARQPFNGNYLAFLGGALLKQGTSASRARAVDVLAKAVAQEPDNAEYRDLYAQSLQRQGRYEEARRQYLQALDTDPYRISCYAPIVDLAWRLQRPGVAAFFPPVIRAVQQRLGEEVTLWRGVWEHPEDAQAHLKLARFLCRTADLTKARYQLQQARELRPDAQEARQLLATVDRAQAAL